MKAPTECRVPENRKVRQSSHVNNANKQRKTIEWERLKIFEKVRNIKRTFHARMGKKKNRKNKDLTEAEEIKKRQQEHTEQLNKKSS